IMEEVAAVERYYEATGGSCLYCEIIATELEEEKRVVSENEKFVAISPYAARFPFETWILPRAHEMAFEDLTDDERTPFARILKDVLGRMFNVLDDPPMNEGATRTRGTIARTRSRGNAWVFSFAPISGQHRVKPLVFSRFLNGSMILHRSPSGREGW